jgi:hypothetical protein
VDEPLVIHQPRASPPICTARTRPEPSRTDVSVRFAMAGAFTRRAASVLPTAALTVGLLLLPQIGIAEPGGVFAKFLGSWRGSGQVVGVNGNSERIVCRATYVASHGGVALSQTLVCASDSYRIDVRSHVADTGRGVQGRWQETTRQVEGSLTGRVADGQFEGSIAGPGFTAEMSLRTNGRKQTVSIRPQGGDIAKVEIVLSRER